MKLCLFIRVFGSNDRYLVHMNPFLYQALANRHHCPAFGTRQ
ncbi:hypothetical protein KF707C_21610 [Metapseudomonas furukawaii]|uniref:Uncharacterized protein n=1 Tax=Metapseudomonas furukawaii TaxID=1149133 RepID=A0AAD1BXU0_METFU|nr:hypothetical protein KF707C_21610 [Pseudomonas furukawaii]